MSAVQASVHLHNFVINKKDLYYAAYETLEMQFQQ